MWAGLIYVYIIYNVCYIIHVHELLIDTVA